MPVLAVNRRARHELSILEELEAGIVLTGAEVKSAKRGEVSLTGSYALLQEETLWLVNCHIAPYRFAHPQTDDDPRRDRKLLLRKAEIQSLIGKLRSQGLTLVPLSLYSKRGLIKISLGLGRGKKLIDKRAAIKKREVQRRIDQALRRRR